MGDHVCFFYGTLMAPQILYRVIHGRPDPEPWQKELLKFQPAILHGFKRHRVRNHSYPAIVAVKSESGTVFKSTSEPESKSQPAVGNGASVLGTLVTGLTDGDIYRLDLFEGDPYIKEEVTVRTLRSDGDENGQGSLQDVLKGVVDSGGGGGAHGASDLEAGKEVVAVTYVWIAGVDKLDEVEWDLETFKREKMAKWIADESMW